MKYKIQGIGLDTTTLDYSPLKLKSRKNNLQYIFTNPAANNDFIISDYLKFLGPEVALVTEINYVDGVDEVLKSHLTELGREKYDLLFLPGNLDYENFDLSVATIKDLGVVRNFGISNPVSLDWLKKTLDYLQELEVSVGSILLNISPLHFQKDIIEYCEVSGITIYGCNGFGGRVNSGFAIDKYSAPFLLNFSGVWSDVVLLSGRDMYQGELSEKYLRELIGKTIENENLYMMDTSVDELIPTPVSVIKGALIIEGMTLPYNNPSYIFNPAEVKLSDCNILPEIKRPEDMTATEHDIDALVQVIYKTEGLGDDDYFVSLRYKVEEFLKISHEDWEKEIIKVTDKILYLKYTHRVMEKKWYGKIVERIAAVDTYLLYYSDGILEFRELKKKEGEKS